LQVFLPTRKKINKTSLTKGVSEGCRPADAVSDFDVDTVIESMSCILSRADSPALKKAPFKAIGLARSRQ
jgi:hypothetical protein